MSSWRSEPGCRTSRRARGRCSRIRTCVRGHQHRRGMPTSSVPTPVVGDARCRSKRSIRPSATYAAPAEWLAAADERIAEWHSYLDVVRSAPDGPPAYAKVIQAINEVCDPDDYIVSAAGGLPGELNTGWRSKSVGSFDSEYGYSHHGLRDRRAWGAKMARPTRRRHRLGRRRLVPDDELGHLLDRDDRPEGDLHRLRQRRVRGHQPAAGQHGWRGVQQPAAHDDHERYVQVDFVKHAEAMGAIAERVDGIDDLGAAFARAKAADRTNVIVIPVDQYSWTEGGAWWEVGVPRSASDRRSVRRARTGRKTSGASASGSDRDGRVRWPGGRHHRCRLVCRRGDRRHPGRCRGQGGPRRSRRGTRRARGGPPRGRRALRPDRCRPGRRPRSADRQRQRRVRSARRRRRCRGELRR